MASTAVDDKSAAVADESDAAAATTATASSCLNDPNYAIICVFLEKFGAHLKIEHPDFLQLQKMIENTDEVHEHLKQFMIRLLRKTRKSVQPDKLDSALAKFCYTYSSQDAWEIERFGYKKSSLAVKLRILKEILESQFDKNPAFRTVISAQSATDLRSQPLGKDKLGNAYWSTLDEQCNLRIYQEHLDEEIWKVVATNRDEMAKLISCLKGNELVLPSLVGIVDEDSSSNSMPPKVDALQNGASAAATANQNEAPAKCENVPSLKIKLNAENSGESTVEQIKTDGASAHATKPDVTDDGDDDDDESNVSEIDESSQAASESSATTIGTKSNETQSSKRYSLLASKPPSNKSKHRIPASDSKARINAKIKTQSWSTGSSKRNLEIDNDTEVAKSKRPSMMSGNKRNVASNKYDDLDDGESSDEEGSEEMDDELEEEEEEELSEISDGDVGEEIEEPTLYVRGEGSGKANKSIPLGDLVQFHDEDENAVGEAITDDVLYVFGQGSGHDCDVGNNDIKSTTEAGSSDIAAAAKPLTPARPMFFFGQAGCLKLSPMKTSIATQPQTQSPQPLVTDEPNANDESLAQEISGSDSDKGIDSTSAVETTSDGNNLAEPVSTEQTTNNVPSDVKTEEPQNDKKAIEGTSTGENDAETKLVENENDGNAAQADGTESNAVEPDAADSDAVDSERIPVEEELCYAKVAYVTTDGGVGEPEKVAQPIDETPENEQIAGNVAGNADVVEPTISNENSIEMKQNTSTVNAIIEDAEPAIDGTDKELHPLTNEFVDGSNEEQHQSVKQDENESENATDSVGIETGAVISTATTAMDEENVTDAIVVPSLPSRVEAASDEKSDKTSEVTSESVVLEDARGVESVEAEVVDPIVSDDNVAEQTESLENIEITSNTIEPKASQSGGLAEHKSTKVKISFETEESQANVEPVESEVASERVIAVDPVDVAETADSTNLTEELRGDDEEPDAKGSPEIFEAAIVTPVEETVDNADEATETIEQISNESEEIAVPEESRAVLEKPAHVEQESCEESPESAVTIEATEPAHRVTNESIATTPHTEQSHQIETIPIAIEQIESSSVAEDVSDIPQMATAVDNEPIETPSSPVDHYPRETTTESEPTCTLSSEKRKGEELSPTDGNECKKICEEGKIVDESCNKAAPLPVEQPQEAISPSIGSHGSEADTTIPKETTAISAIDGELNAVPASDQNTSICNENDRAAEPQPLDPLPIVPTAEVAIEPEPLSIVSTEEETKHVEVETQIKLPSPKTEQIPIESKVSSAKAAQSRTRKRRLSGEKIRLSSESENDGFDAAAAEPFSPVPDVPDSDDEVGGKRIKMRTKVSLRSVRKNAEEKRRNQKESECSSDDNEKLSAKQSTSESRPKLRSRKVVESKSPEEKHVASETVEKVAEEKPSIESKPEIKAEEVKVETETEQSEVVKLETDREAQEEEPEVPAAAPRRAGRPPRKAAAKKAAVPKPKAAPKAPAPPKEAKTVEPEANAETEVKTESSEGAKSQPRKKKRSLLGLDVSDVAIIPASTDGETPVRQSRRIAQIKIKEEAERRKAEEIALKKMKEASEKNKKGSSKTSSAAAGDGASDAKSESEEENSESEQKLEKKKKRKKGNKERPWQTDSSDSSERDEEDVDDHEEVERLPPLRSDHEFSPESDIEDEVIVPTKRARTARKDVTEKGAAAESSEDEDIHACQKCGKNDHPEWILLCDKCDKGYHCSCLIPVLFVIPEGSWFCPPCQQEKLIEELETKLIAYDAVVKQKEIEEAQRQRAIFTSINEANVLKEEKARKANASRERSQRIKGGDSSDDYSSSSSSSQSESERIEKRPRRFRQLKDDDESNSDRSTAKRNDTSSAATDSDDEPIYKLRKRRQANVSYRFNEYDELINRAIKSEMDEAAGAGNLGRGKDISTIIDADKEDKRQKKEEDESNSKSRRESESDHAPKPISRGKHMGDTDEDSEDSEPIKPKVVKRSGGKNSLKKKKKLNSLDVDSDEDDFDSDDDFKTSSYSDDEEEEDASSADSESSLEFLGKRGKKGRTTSQRPVRQRKKRFDADFIDDNSDDDDDIPLSKRKKKIESDFSDFNDSSDDEVEEDVDSEDLCDDSSEGSDRAWRKSKKSAKSKSANTSRPAAPKPAPKKKVKNEDERAFKGSTKKKAVIASDDDDDDEVLPKSRRTRGKRLPYLLEDEFDSSDDGIKPGVKRPDTPPEERAAFIQKQEEIKRMLAEKNVDVTKPSAGAEKSKKNAPKDSLSTIPLQIIQTAKALDVDLKKTAITSKTSAATAASDNDSNGFDDDLPEDFDPEDMDEDEIAKMMEEEEFAQQQLKLAGEAIRSKRLKDTNDDSPKKDISPMKIETSSSVIMPHLAALVSPTNFSGSLTIPDIPPSMYTVAQAAPTAPTTSNNKIITTTPKKRGRKFKDDNLLLAPVDMVPKAVKSLNPPKEPLIPVSAIHHTASLAHQKPSALQMHLGPSTMHSPPIQQHPPSVISHSSSVIQHQRPLPPSSSSLLGIARNQEPIIPSAVLEVQNTRLLDPSELGRPPQLPPSATAMHDPAASLLDSPVKKRGRRKKITPLRDALTNPTSAGVDLRHPNLPPSQPPLAAAPNPPTASAIPDTPKTSILSERLAGNPADNKRGLPIGAQPPPPHLYAPPGASQTSVIRSLIRPPLNAPFSSGNAPQQQRYYPPNHALPPPSHTLPSHIRPTYHAPNAIVTSSGHRAPPLVNTSPSSSHLSHPMYMRRGQPTMYGTGYPGMPPPQMHRALQAMEAASGSAQEYTGPYQNLPFGNYYPPPGPTTAHLSSSSSTSASSERRPSAAAISTFEQFDNVNKAAVAAHDRYTQHLSNISISAISTPDDERSARSGDANAAPNTAANAGGGSEFSGLVSYFSSQQDDLDT